MGERIGAIADAGDVVLGPVKNESKCGGDRRLVVDGENTINAFHVQIQSQQRSGQVRVGLAMEKAAADFRWLRRRNESVKIEAYEP